MTSRQRKLHFAAVGAEALDGVRAMAVPIVVLAVVGGGASTESLGRVLAYGVLGTLASTLFAYIGWTVTWWSVGSDVVRLRTGVLSERIVAVPFDRVQAIDTVRGPVQRLFGVVELHVQTAGGGQRGEIVLKAVTPADADALREAIRASGAPAAAAPERPPEELPSWRLGRGALVVAALTSASLAVLVPVAAGLSQVLDDVLGSDDLERLFPATAAGAAMLAGAVLALAWILSFFGTIVAFAGFTVSRDGERLRIRRGIVERREASVPVARVHAVRLVESPLREPLGLLQVRVETAGYAAEAATAQTLLPLVRRRDAAAVLHRLLPELDGPPLDQLERPPRRARRRFVLPPLAPAVALAAGLIAWLGATALPALALVAAAGLYGEARYRAAGYAFARDRLVVRGRGLARTTYVADARRLQRVGAATSPFQRRARLAHLEAAVSSGRGLRARHLDAAAADDLVRRLIARATG